MMVTIDKSEAVRIAAMWHSVMTWSDPGVTMYALSSTGRVQSPEHRVALLDYMVKECYPIVAERRAEAEKKDDGDLLHAADIDSEELDDLREYIENCPLEPNHE